ncbi:MAG TPA: hypothetical protein VIH33_05505 [Candidatus Limnocylindria bacterium]
MGRTAVGSSGGWQWLPPAVPWLVAAATALAIGLLVLSMVESGRDYPMLITLAGALVGGIVLVGLASALRGGAGLFVRAMAALVGAVAGGVIAAFLSDAIVNAPFAFAVIAGLLVGAVVLGWRLQIARSAHEAAKSVGFVPALIWILLLLAAIPAIQAGAEIIITRASVPAFVERQVGFSSSLVEIRGLAQLPPYQAEAPLDPDTGLPAAGTFRWFPLRDELSDPRFALVRSQLDAATLERREIVARVDPGIDSDAAVVALRARGMDVPDAVNAPPLQALGDQAAADAGGVQTIGSVDALDGLASGTVVRLTLDFPGDAVAACALRQDCDARRLAIGTGQWLHLAHDPASGAPILVQLPYPPTVAPMHVYGRQTSDDGAVGRFLDGPQVRQLLGWAQVLRGAIIEQDPGLPVDRLWLGPILFVVLAVLLALGRWSGYPVFHATPLAAGRWPTASRRATARTEAVAPIGATASGYVAPPGRSPIELDGDPVSLALSGDEMILTLLNHEPPLQVTIPRALGALSGMEAGELRYLTGRRSALRIGWYGSQVLLVFDDDVQRDAAATLLSGVG